LSAAGTGEVTPIPALSPGDVIGVAAPASPAETGSIQAGVAYLEGLGYRVRLGRDLSVPRGYLAGGDAERAASLNGLIADPEVRCLLFARGGYGTARIIDRIDLQSLWRRPRLVVGYSDITVLLLALQSRGSYPVGYGPHVADLGIPSQFQARSFRRLLSEGPGSQRFSLSRCRTLIPGAAEGILRGGCLTLLQNSIGTSWQPDLNGAILFWEEWREAPYRIDRMLQHLRSAGLLSGIRGMLIGRPIRIRPGRGRPSLSYEEVILDHAGQMGVPVVTGFPAGHGAHKVTLPLEVRVRLDTHAALLETVPTR
jgi:muramoyltetrapeptide carboxypeptidase